MPPTTHILIFVRSPFPGQAKTRLIPALGSERAAQLHRRPADSPPQFLRPSAILPLPRNAAGKLDGMVDENGAADW
jgi:hypothetical protein